MVEHDDTILHLPLASPLLKPIHISALLMHVPEPIGSGNLIPGREIGLDERAAGTELYKDVVKLMNTRLGRAQGLYREFDETGSASGIKTVLICRVRPRSEEHTSELQSLMRISYAVFCLKKKKNTQK